VRFLQVYAAAALCGLCANARPNWAGQMVSAHNHIRKQVHVPKLKWSDELAKVAEDWAKHLAKENLFEHSRGQFGENLFSITEKRAPAKQVVEAWASEERNYDYKTNRCRKGECGHYTQIVWRGTAEVGCGVARQGRREVWVCEYSPPGNYVGQRPY